jgi:hypothetical protein
MYKPKRRADRYCATGRRESEEGSSGLVSIDISARFWKLN